MEQAGRLLHRNWDLYDTRHTVFQPARMSAEHLKRGYWRAYQQFYRWPNILAAARSKPNLIGVARHMAYSAGWKKFEPLWDTVLRARRAARMRPVLESVLHSFGKLTPQRVEQTLRGQLEHRPSTPLTDPLVHIH